ncbi:ATP-binding cassette domain-containing protein [Gemmiger formicilis]|uniref:ATP-binding cassette domain-containing protein n=1 Tax=Gemmiger formicilis TaxID=745368 RepID=UPI003F96A415
MFKDCASLSGGELARLRFAELALERPNLMFLDEPTNHLDIFMRESADGGAGCLHGHPAAGHP